MDYEAEIKKLQNQLSRQRADLLAYHIVFMSLFHALGKFEPFGKVVGHETFRYADHFSELAVAKLGSPDNAEYVTRAAEVIEQLRAASIKDEGKPQGGI